MSERASPLRRAINLIYGIALYTAGVLICLICLLVTAQVALNAATRFLPLDLPPSIPSYAEIAGFMLAGATFLALGPTLKAGGHVRITLFTQRISENTANFFSIAVLLVGSVFTAFAFVFAGYLVFESIEFGDKSYGSVKISLWIPQLTMFIGLGIMLLAFMDDLVVALVAQFKGGSRA